MLSTLRRRGRDAALDADVEDRGSSADEALHKEFAEHELQTLIKDLSPADRELLIRIAVNEQSQKEIAADLGTAHATVRKRWERLRGHLRKSLAPISFLMFFIGVGGGTVLTLSALTLSMHHLRAPPPFNVEPETPLIMETEAAPPMAVTRPPKAMTWPSERIDFKAEHSHLFASLQSATMDICVHGKGGKSYNPDLLIVYTFDADLGATVRVSGKRAAKIKACIDRKVLPRFVVTTLLALSKRETRDLRLQGPYQFTVKP